MAWAGKPKIEKELADYLAPRNIWRPQGDLNPCYRRERPVSWARLDDGDVAISFGGPCWIRTSDSLLKRQILCHLS